MAGGPRKFSEKIALLNQKEAEGNAAYASVMAQVVQIRPNGTDEPQQQAQQQQQQYQNNAAARMGQAPYLQLPTQSESFRRAVSDSSIHQSVNNMNNNAMQPMMMQQAQMANNHVSPPHQQQQQQQFNYMQQQQQQQMYQQQQNYQNNYQPQQQQQQRGFQNGQNDYGSPGVPYRNLTLPIMPATSGGPVETNSASASPAHSPHHFTSPTMGGGGHVSPTNFLLPKMPKSEPQVAPLSSPGNASNGHAMTSPNGNRLSLSPGYVPQPTQPPQLPSPTSPTSSPGVFSYQNHQQQSLQMYQASFQQPQMVNNNNSNNFLNANMQNTQGGSLPDLTAFHLQNNNNNQIQQHLQLPEYAQRHHQQQQQQQQQQLQQQSPQYDLLLPNIPQHNHIGPVKHNSSVSPTRVARYSPTSNMSNRRPSPQRNIHNDNPGLSNINTQMINSSLSTPTSPSHPSGQVQPPLEFVINPVIANYAGGSLHNGSLSVNNTGSLSNQIIYRNNPNSAESLPPSPQSQHSCFNSPQGSPGPISISPQDMNPFTSGGNGGPSSVNYDQMHKKFDQINLDASMSQASYNYNMPPTNTSNYGSIALTSPPGIKGGAGAKPSPNEQPGLPNGGMHDNAAAGGIPNGIMNANGVNTSNGVNGGGGGDMTGANDHNSPSSHNNGSRSGSLSSTGSGVGLNQLASNNNNGQIEDINLQSLINYQQSPPPVPNNANSLSPPGSNGGPSMHPLSAKTHKNSIPNIILTFSGDSIEEKNDLIIKDLSTDYNEELPIDVESLQMLNHDPNMLAQALNEQTLYQNT